ncbi:MAG: exodeoxyribonuclease VII small subunit [Clostridia bacterium]|nr:exodeoxyribonuclease VII small subunit [Clostridia bacterium]MDD4375745.1 exodeoxyribonuclease VII small subunit [Clostridia bacterium]
MSKEKTFEDNLKELENIVNLLEKGDVSLDESINKFEEGIKISKACNKKLEEAEKKINIIINGEEKEFDIEE